MAAQHEKALAAEKAKAWAEAHKARVEAKKEAEKAAADAQAACFPFAPFLIPSCPTG